jgi:prepilin-type N-terminal cleavage/methylation domain-containing protein
MASRTSSTNRRAHRRGGFTLAESLIASVVLAIAVVAVSGSILASQSQNTTQFEDTMALNLARELMEEIAAVPLSTADASSWPSVTDRTQYDRVNDFNGYSDIVKIPLRLSSSNVSGSVSLSSARPSVTVVTSGSPTLSAEQYRRTVSISYPTTPVSGATVAAGDFAIVTVTVQSANGNAVTLPRLFTRTTVKR